MVTFKIEASTVKALLLIAAKEDIRYYLNGVCLDTMRTVPALVATDGRRMLVVRMTHVDGEPADIADKASGAVIVDGVYGPGQYIIPRELLASVAPRKDGRTVLPLTVTISGEAVCVEGATTATGKLINGRYPDWRRVLPNPDGSDRMPAQFDTDYVADFGKVAKLLTGAKDAQPRFRHCGPNNPALVTFTDGAPDAVGVLMPMRLDVEHVIPAWVSGNPPAPAEAVAV